jgi:hypothetical protein
MMATMLVSAQAGMYLENLWVLLLENELTVDSWVRVLIALGLMW